jgi:TetR/AcrR family transcriptional regulator, regulator of cefoperazone and chloramphenicol sensitivity
MSRTDNETRQRLLEAGRRLFSDGGFEQVTVREICRAADANVAAINYHFGGKQGLYRAVFEQGIALMQETTDLSLRAAPGSTPEDRLRVFIQTVVDRMMRDGNDGWLARLLQHEIENPTETLDDVLERAIGPRLRALGDLVAAVIRCEADDVRVGRGVASIQMQLALAARMRHPLADRMKWRHTWTAQDLGRHIADFSIGGLAALREAGDAPASGTAPAGRPAGPAATSLPTSLL